VAGLPHSGGPPPRARPGAARPADGQLLRYADGRPIIHRRYDHLRKRIGRHLPWAATQGISTHWIRHDPDVGRRDFGYAVARAYAGHTHSGSETGATATYVRASLAEVAAARGRAHQ
jgi:integrase/recombinase XerC